MPLRPDNLTRPISAIHKNTFVRLIQSQLASQLPKKWESARPFCTSARLPQTPKRYQSIFTRIMPSAHTSETSGTPGRRGTPLRNSGSKPFGAMDFGARALRRSLAPPSGRVPLAGEFLDRTQHVIFDVERGAHLTQNTASDARCLMCSPGALLRSLWTDLRNISAPGWRDDDLDLVETVYCGVNPVVRMLPSRLSSGPNSCNPPPIRKILHVERKDLRNAVCRHDRGQTRIMHVLARDGMLGNQSQPDRK